MTKFLVLLTLHLFTFSVLSSDERFTPYIKTNDEFVCKQHNINSLIKVSKNIKQLNTKSPIDNNTPINDFADLIKEIVDNTESFVNANSSFSIMPATSEANFSVSDLWQKIKGNKIKPTYRNYISLIIASSVIISMVYDNAARANNGIAWDSFYEFGKGFDIKKLGLNSVIKYFVDERGIRSVKGVLNIFPDQICFAFNGVFSFELFNKHWTNFWMIGLSDKILHFDGGIDNSYLFTIHDFDHLYDNVILSGLYKLSTDDRNRILYEHKALFQLIKNVNDKAEKDYYNAILFIMIHELVENSNCIDNIDLKIALRNWNSDPMTYLRNEGLVKRLIFDFDNDYLPKELLHLNYFLLNTNEGKNSSIYLDNFGRYYLDRYRLKVENLNIKESANDIPDESRNKVFEKYLKSFFDLVAQATSKTTEPGFAEAGLVQEEKIN